MRIVYPLILSKNIKHGCEYKGEPPFLEELKKRPDGQPWMEMVEWLSVLSKCEAITEFMLHTRPARQLTKVSKENIYKSACIAAYYTYPSLNKFQLSDIISNTIGRGLQGIQLSDE